MCLGLEAYFFAWLAVVCSLLMGICTVMVFTHAFLARFHRSFMLPSRKLNGALADKAFRRRDKTCILTYVLASPGAWGSIVVKALSC